MRHYGVLAVLVQLLAAILVLSACMSITHPKPVDIGEPLVITCQEDMACWDCHTMGNHVCGVTP